MDVLKEFVALTRSVTQTLQVSNFSEAVQQHDLKFHLVASKGEPENILDSREITSHTETDIPDNEEHLEWVPTIQKVSQTYLHKKFDDFMALGEMLIFKKRWDHKHVLHHLYLFKRTAMIVLNEFNPADPDGLWRFLNENILELIPYFEKLMRLKSVSQVWSINPHKRKGEGGRVETPNRKHRKVIRGPQKMILQPRIVDREPGLKLKSNHMDGSTLIGGSDESNAAGHQLASQTLVDNSSQTGPSKVDLHHPDPLAPSRFEREINQRSNTTDQEDIMGHSRGFSNHESLHKRTVTSAARDINGVPDQPKVSAHVCDPADSSTNQAKRNSFGRYLEQIPEFNGGELVSRLRQKRTSANAEHLSELKHNVPHQESRISNAFSPLNVSNEPNDLADDTTRQRTVSSLMGNVARDQNSITTRRKNNGAVMDVIRRNEMVDEMINRLHRTKDHTPKSRDWPMAAGRQYHH